MLPLLLLRAAGGANPSAGSGLIAAAPRRGARQCPRGLLEPGQAELPQPRVLRGRGRSEAGEAAAERRRAGEQQQRRRPQKLPLAPPRPGNGSSRGRSQRRRPERRQGRVQRPTRAEGVGVEERARWAQGR